MRRQPAICGWSECPPPGRIAGVPRHRIAAYGPPPTSQRRRASLLQGFAWPNRPTGT
jgi:hypothetical protein